MPINLLASRKAVRSLGPGNADTLVRSQYYYLQILWYFTLIAYKFQKKHLISPRQSKKVTNRHGDLSRASSMNSVVKSRCFHLYDHSKTSRLPMSLSLTYKRIIPSILKKQKKKGMRFTNTRPLKQRKVNIMDDSQSSSSSSSSSSLISTSSSLTPSCFSSSSEDTVKTVMPNNILLDNDQSSSPQPHSSFSPPPFNNNGSQTQQRNNNVTFHSKVLVMRIPSRKQYPESMKRSMWCSMSEISRSAARNSIEFQSEGWDWRLAVEENRMYYHPKSGQYIHPVHVKRSSSSSSTSSTSNVDNNNNNKQEAEAAPVAVLKDVDTKESMEAQPTHE
jgi:hypothetical protein